MTQIAESSEPGPGTATSSAFPGWVLVGLAVVGLGLVFAHPDAPAATFADFVRNEANSQTIDAIVHGGFVIVLIGFFVTSAAIARTRPAAFVSTAAIVFTAVGFLLISQSLIIDGLVSPSVAAYYVGKGNLDDARPAFVMFRAITSILLPFGLVFWAAAGLAWTKAAMRRAAGSPVWSWVSYGLATISLILTAIIIARSQPFLVIFVLVCQLLWMINFGLFLAKHTQRIQAAYYAAERAL